MNNILTDDINTKLVSDLVIVINDKVGNVEDTQIPTIVNLIHNNTALEKELLTSSPHISEEYFGVLKAFNDIDGTKKKLKQLMLAERTTDNIYKMSTIFNNGLIYYEK